jgi:hypothetical protein
MSPRTLPVVLCFVLLALRAGALPVPTTLQDFHLPGSQPGQSGTLENPSQCDNCHSGYGEPLVEPVLPWKGSMMAQAMRDPFFEACLAIANQDAPQSGDLCLRCHTPKGWLEGRSEPTDGSALTAADREGIQCAFCHRLVAPASLGINLYPEVPAYTSGTWPRDQTYLGTLAQIPPTNADGMYVADSNTGRRGPFFDSVARHADFGSPFHSDSRLCGTCHDVSNPVFTRDPATGRYLPNAFGQAAPDAHPRSLFPIERTYSEWSVSAYNTPEGVFAPQFGGNLSIVRSCQDCHMRDVTGHGCSMNNAPLRTNLPLHDFTGGNTVVPRWVAQRWPGEVDVAALENGIARARAMLRLAASVSLAVDLEGDLPVARVRVVNETGHKLPSGYPEGRRIWLNVRAFDVDSLLVYESGAYDPVSAWLSHDPDLKVYEVKPGLSPSLAAVVQEPPGPSFHFVQNDSIWSDNRIPPRGFTNAAFQAIQSPAVGHAYADGQHWDDTSYELPASAVRVDVALYYQTTSREYMDFLRDENVTNTAGQVAWNLWDANGRSAPEWMAGAGLSFQPPVPGLAHTPYPPDDATDVDPHVMLAWQPGARSLRHRVHLGPAGVDPPAFVAEVEEPFLALTEPLPEWTEWCWRVDEVNAAGTTTGELWSFHTAGALDPPVPLLIHWTAAGALLEWSAVPQAALYRIYRLDAPNDVPNAGNLVAEVAGTSWLDVDVAEPLPQAFYLVTAFRP